jgi:hypothetical protein
MPQINCPASSLSLFITASTLANRYAVEFACRRVVCRHAICPPGECIHCVRSASAANPPIRMIGCFRLLGPGCKAPQALTAGLLSVNNTPRMLRRGLL